MDRPTRSAVFVYSRRRLFRHPPEDIEPRCPLACARVRRTLP